MRTLSVLLLIAVAVCGTVAFEASRGAGAAPGKANCVVVNKTAHTLCLYRGEVLLKTYRVALGRGGSEAKQHAGDNKVPEGNYGIVGRNAHSAYYRALRVSYPTPAQARMARAQGADPGGDIMIHGIRNGLGWLGPFHRIVDWTKGCVAVTDREMDQIWASVQDGTPVEIEH